MKEPQKRFKLRADQIKTLAKGYGGCIATDMITVRGMKVGYMYREEPRNQYDSGWCFTAGVETREFMADAANHGVYDVNEVANFDPDIIPLLESPAGSAFQRDRLTGAFFPVEFLLSE